MNRTLGCLQVALFAGIALLGCADSGNGTKESVETGTLALPLVTQGTQGTQYQLRNATFQISRYGYYYEGTGGYASSSTVGRAGATSRPTTAPNVITVSSETNPDAPSIEVELEEGDYYIYLQPGWSLERVENGVATPVEAQLLSGQSQWAYVYRHSTNWIEYQFGIGNRALWFNGKLNLSVQVYEQPEDYYGYSYGGSTGIAGAPVVPAGGAVVSVGGATGL